MSSEQNRGRIDVVKTASAFRRLRSFTMIVGTYPLLLFPVAVVLVVSDQDPYVAIGLTIFLYQAFGTQIANALLRPALRKLVPPLLSDVIPEVAKKALSSVSVENLLEDSAKLFERIGAKDRFKVEDMRWFPCIREARERLDALLESRGLDPILKIPETREIDEVFNNEFAASDTRRIAAEIVVAALHKEQEEKGNRQARKLALARAIDSLIKERDDLTTWLAHSSFAPRLQKIMEDGNNWRSFEEFCKDLFLCMGYEATLTRDGADDGVDIIAVKGRERIAIQCKLWLADQKVGNKEISHLVAGKIVYDCTAATFTSTSQFTEPALAAAKKLKCETWDLQRLKAMAAQHFPRSHPEGQKKASDRIREIEQEIERLRTDDVKAA